MQIDLRPVNQSEFQTKDVFFLALYMHEQSTLKHKDSFGKSDNLSKTFHAEIVVFHPAYECKSSSSNGQL